MTPKAKKAPEGPIVYLCGTQFHEELGPDGAPGSLAIYNSVDNLKDDTGCWKECGIVEAEVRERRWVEPLNWTSKGISPSREAHPPRLKTEYKKAQGKEGTLLRVKSPDGAASLEILYDNGEPLLSIGGITASKSEWRRILAPVLHSNGSED